MQCQCTVQVYSYILVTFHYHTSVFGHIYPCDKTTDAHLSLIPTPIPYPRQSLICILSLYVCLCWTLHINESYNKQSLVSGFFHLA